MGNTNSSTPSIPKPVILPPPCNAECQRKKAINKAKDKYKENKDKLRNIEKEYKQSWAELNTLEYGPEWIMNEDKKKNNYGLLDLYKKKLKEIEMLSENYNNNLEIIYNQLLITENQMEKKDQIDTYLNTNLKSLKKKKNIYSTNLRKYKYEKEKYRNFSNNMSILTNSFISSLIIYICLLICYKLLILYNVKIQLIEPIELPKWQFDVSSFGKFPRINKGFLTK